MLKVIILSLLFVASSQAFDRCVHDYDMYTKHTDKVMLALELTSHSSPVDAKMAIHYGISALVECEDRLTAKTVKSIRGTIKILKGL